MRALIDLSSHWNDRSLTIIAIHDYDPGINSVADLNTVLSQWSKQWWAGREPAFAIAMDGPGDGRIVSSSGVTHNAYHIDAWPTALLIDRNGNIIHVFGDRVLPEVVDSLLDRR